MSNGIERLAQLAAASSGTIAAPGDDGYEQGRRVWNARCDRHPAVVARCRESSDVVAAVGFAREHGLEISVKSGGHAYAANTVGDGSLLVDLSPLRGVEIDPEARRARVGCGATWGDLDGAAQRHGLATPGPTVSTVGLGGSTLGGGNGYLTRLHGMTVDNLLSAQMATADGRVVRASADENGDLFWALRGGGGNFGVVTELELQLHPVGPEVLAGQIVHRFADAEAVLRAYRDFTAGAADEIQCYAFVLRVPPIPEFPEEHHGELAVDLVVFHADPGATESLRPLLDLGEPILAYATPQPYTTVQQSFDAGLPSGQRYESRAHDLAELSDRAIATFVSGIGELPGAFTMAYFAPGGGAAARVDATATAFPHRHAPQSVHVIAGWSRPEEDETTLAWVRDLHQAMAPFSTGGVYVNLLGTDERDRVRAAYGPNYDRLLAIKREWDPDNRFRANHNLAVAR